MHILSPETDNCPSWISGRERMTVQIFHSQSPRKNVADLGGGWTRDLLVSSRTAHPTEPPRPATTWIENIKTILCSVCFSGFRDNQNFINATWFTKSSNQKFKDQFIQKWTSHIDITSKSNTYRFFKTSSSKMHICFDSFLLNYTKHYLNLGREIADSQ